jgi:ABC-type Zn uptake system ZnuABC Zn-binding protein ZnuA
VLYVVTTVSPITSLVENIGGSRIILQGIVPEGTNSHTFEPAPSVASVLSRADLIVLNGLYLEEPSLEMARANSKDDTMILSLGDKTITPSEWVYDFSFPESDGHPNPHLWTNPILALKYSELILEALVSLDSINAEYYRANFKKFSIRIEDLDKRIQVAVGTIPEENRKLLTYHDSFPFFGSQYGLEIIGAVQPSDFREPSAKEVARLIDQVRENGVPAIFGSDVFPSPIMQQIAKEGRSVFIDQLRDDDLPGGPGDATHSYLGLMASNVEIMVTALGGNADSMIGFDSSLVFEEESQAIYPE